MKERIREAFQRDGFYHARAVFTSAEMDKLEADFDRIVTQLQNNGETVNVRWKGGAVDKIDNGGTEIYHTHNVQRYSGAWMAAWMQENFLMHVQAILGEDIVLHHSKLFQKPSEKGAPFPIHQDWSYFPTRKDSMIAAIVHVSEATDEMGCLRVYPGSHRLGRLEHTDGREESDVLRDYPLEKALPVECQRGDVVFFHYFTLHGSMPNRSDRIRKTVLAQMHSGNDQVDAEHQHTYERLVLSGFNKHMRRTEAARAR